MRLLMLTWRYVDNPAAGGAEVLTHEVLKRLARQGHHVTCFTAMHPGASERDDLDGVSVVRRGRQSTVHFHAWRWLRRQRDRFDLVIDQINTIPFFTPLYVPRRSRRLFIHQLAREYWWRETRGAFRLVAPVGYLLEPWMIRLYRRTPAITVSESSRDDLVARGLPRDGVAIVPEALTFSPLESLDEKPEPFSVVMVGRLTPAKFVEEGIRAFALVQRALPGARLEVVGAGDQAYRERLERIVERSETAGVTFHGRVSERRKLELLRGAQVHVFTSHREGWGLVVSEAAAMGTPSIGYDVPGVRDSVGDPRLLTPCGDVAGLADRVLALERDRELYDEVRRAAWEATLEMSYERTAQAFMAALEEPSSSSG